MPNSRIYIQRLVDIFSSVKLNNNDIEEKITVHAAVGRFAFFYEKIRNLVDYKDEHLIRKAAILRILRRLLVMEKDPHVLAEHLVRELIAAGYLSNGTLPLSIIEEVAWKVHKLQVIININAGTDSHVEWLKAITSVEIEDILVDSTREKGLVSFLYDRIFKSISVRGMEIETSILQLQIYLACYRAVVNADDEILGYKLLRAFLPEWLSPQSWINEPRAIAERLVAVERRIKKQLHHPLALRFQHVVKPWAVALNVLTIAIEKNSGEVSTLLNDQTKLDIEIKKVIDKKYATTKTKVRRVTARAVLYLFLTKMVLALVLEGPAELFLYQKINLFSLTINLLFPPVLMFFVGLFIRIPGIDNTKRIQSALKEILDEEAPAMRVISAPPHRSKSAKFGLTMTYFLTFILVFGLISYTLDILSFTWISMLIFLFFLSLVSFFAYRIRLGAREYLVIDRKITLWNSLVDFFSIPILSAGRLLSKSINRINIFLFFFDFIFEAPYKMFLQLLEEWFAFAKEKKDELQP